MRKLLAIALCVLVPTSIFAAEGGYKVAYDGGSVPGVKAGTDLKIYIESDQIVLSKDKR